VRVETEYEKRKEGRGQLELRKRKKTRRSEEKRRRKRYSPKVPQHEGSGKEHSGRVGNVLSHDVLGDVSGMKGKEGKVSLSSRVQGRDRRGERTYRHPFGIERKIWINRSVHEERRWVGEDVKTYRLEESELLGKGKGGRKSEVSELRFRRARFVRLRRLGTEKEASTHSTHVASRNNSRSSNESGTDVSNDVSVKVRSDDDVELLRVGDELHGAVLF